MRIGVRAVLPLLLILTGLVLGWADAQRSHETLAWIFVAGGLLASIIDQVFRSPRAGTAQTVRAASRHIIYMDSEEWSHSIATLVVDALLQADVVASSDVPRAIEIAGEEIAVRLDIGDYPAAASVSHAARSDGA